MVRNKKKKNNVFRAQEPHCRICMIITNLIIFRSRGFNTFVDFFEIAKTNNETTRPNQVCPSKETQLTSRREQKVVEKKNTHFFTFKILEHTRKIVNFGAG